MPVFSALALLLLRCRARGAAQVVHYERLPVYLRALERVLGLDAAFLASVLARLTGATLERIRHGETVPGYPALRMGAMHDAAAVATELAPVLRRSAWMELMARLFGEEAAEAYLLKHLAHHHLHLHLLPVLACARMLPPSAPLTLVVHPGWPAAWIELLRRRIGRAHMELFQWPRWYRALHRGVFTALALVAFPALVAVRLLRGGVTLRQESPRPFTFITEFVDPIRMNGSPYDADYLVDGVRIARSDVLFYLTHAQAGKLQRGGHDPGSTLRRIRADGYEAVRLDELPFPLRRLRRLARLYRDFATRLRTSDAPMLAVELLRGLRDWLEFVPLFDRHRAAYSLHLQIPHGDTGWRTNSAAITGLCRQRGVRSAGCQTRILEGNEYEHCFDCYDTYFSWGAGWQRSLEEGARFLGKIVEIGCIHLDSLAPRPTSRAPGALGAKATRARRVTIFTSDMEKSQAIYSGGYLTFAYALSFLRQCAELAREYPDITFVLKTKDPEHVDLVLADPSFRRLHAMVERNFAFERRQRCDYASALLDADIVLAIGFTTPGIEALLLGKRAIYYSEVYGRGEAFKLVPGLVAESPRELRRLFASAVEDHLTFASKHAAYIGLLDPFRDGAARERITRVLSSAG